MQKNELGVSLMLILFTHHKFREEKNVKHANLIWLNPTIPCTIKLDPNQDKVLKSSSMFMLFFT